MQYPALPSSTQHYPQYPQYPAVPRSTSQYLAVPAPDAELAWKNP